MSKHTYRCRAFAGLLAMAFLAEFVPRPLNAVEPRTHEEEAAKDAADRFQVVLADNFDGKLHLNWKPVRYDDTHVSLTKNPGKLTITTQRGSIFGDEKNDAFGAGVQAKNIFVLDNPLAKDVDFTVITCVSGFTPQVAFQQAGLILYDDDDNYLKWGYEFDWDNNGGQVFTIVAETDGKPEFQHMPPASGADRYWVRLTKRGNNYEYAASLDGNKFTVYGEQEWNGRAKQLGLLAKNGGNKDAPDIDANFEFFELLAPPPAAKP
jgi:hypothetical protein